MTHTEKTYIVEYDSNNSGGGWWLTDKQWHLLELAGWEVEWGGLDFCNEKYRFRNEPNKAPNTCAEMECHGHRRYQSYEEALAADDRWLGCLARGAKLELQAYSDTLAESLGEQLWTEDLLNEEDPNDEGCNCCGRPHIFYAQEKK